MSNPVRDLKQELLAAAERQRGMASRSRPAGRGIRNRVLLVAATLTVFVAGALFVTAPWKSSPGFLEQSAAALAPPPGSILHLKWNETHTSEGLGCTQKLGTQELWIDQNAPHRYRVLAWSLVYGGKAITDPCRHEGRIVELGGMERGTDTPLMFVPPDGFKSAIGIYATYPTDPARTLRDAIAEGRAHDEGETQIDGRTVERIRLECAHPPCKGSPWYTYVDPETFALVREDSPHGFGLALTHGEVIPFDVVTDYLTYEYLPRTAANLALTDIRAQHPKAKGP